MRNLEMPGRSPVHSLNGVAATSHPLATQTAIAVLRDGGNAMDAAVAACAVQCVVEPQSTGIGGDCFVLYAPGGGDGIIGYNGSGRAPQAATQAWFAEKGITEIDQNSPHAVTIPGAVDAWARLIEDHGTKSLGDLLRPAVAYARDGYPIHSRVAFDFALYADMLRLDDNCARTFLAEGKPPHAGDTHHQPELADTLEKIGEHGRNAFYKGPVAEDMVSTLSRLGGVHTLEDFAAHQGEYVTPIQTSYAGYEVYQCPPNGQGVIALLLLNLRSGLGMEGLAPLSADRLHLEIEMARLAYQDRDAVIADPAQASVPVERLLSDDHAAALGAHIRRDRAMDPLPPSSLAGQKDTVQLCVVDKDRNAVSFINSLYHPFGSGLLAPQSGVLLQNRGQGFSLDAGHPNCIAPRKRPLHTIIPGMVCENGRAVMPFGVMGGAYQAAGHAYFLTNLLVYGMDVQEAIDLPRLFPWQGTVDVEGGIPTDVVEELRDRGHKTTKPIKPIGGAQAIWIDWDRGVLSGGSDPRKDGCALGY